MPKNTNDPSLTSWVDVPEGSDFPVQNIPFGIYRSAEGLHACSAIGNQLIDLVSLYDLGLLKDTGVTRECLDALAGSLNIVPTLVACSLLE